jgi:hypothetical protein
VIFESAVEGVAQTPAIRVSFAVLEGAPAPSFDIGAEVKVGFEERFSAPKAEEKSEPLAVPVLPEFN